MSFDLRDYQYECVYDVAEAFSEYKTALAVLPTGSGKSVVMHGLLSHAIEGGASPILVMVHKTELVHQLAETLCTIDGARVVIERAEHIELQTADEFDIAVCSIQTLLSRPEVIDNIPWGLALIDETHRALADGYLDILERIGVGTDTGPYLIGFTATAFRGDDQPLSDLYETVAYERDILWAVRDGWLVPIRAQRLGFAEVNEKGKLIHRVLEDDELLEHTLDKYQEHCVTDTGDVLRPTLIMASSVDDGEEIAAYFTDAGHEAQMISYKTPAKQRAQHLKRFKDGELGILVAMNVLIEGFDAPRASAMFWMRNTKSAVVFAQGLGRITRPFFTDQDAFAQFNQSTDATERRELIKNSAKPDAIFFDCTDISSQYNLVTLGTAMGLAADFDFELEDIMEVVDNVDSLLGQYQVLSADVIHSATEIGLVTEDAQLWREAVTPNIGVPEEAELTYTKHRDHWLLTFPVRNDQYDCNIPHLVKIVQDAKGQWLAYLGQPEVWREWYWNSRRKRWLQKYYRGQDPPDTEKTTQIRGRPVKRYTKIAGMPFQPILTARDKTDIFLDVERYVETNYGRKLWNLLGRDAHWRSQAPSDRQDRMLKRMRKRGIALPKYVDSGTASILTDRFFLGLLEPAKLVKRR